MKRFTAVIAVAATVFAGLVASTWVQAAASSAAGFTGVNVGVDGPGHCLHGSITNCNAYDGKQYVWLNAGPSSASLDPGTYFFAVLAPGAQPDPNDGSVLSTDAYTNRTFTVDGSGNLSYLGSHDFDSNSIRLIPYADTTNNGGVYIMAICSLAAGYPVVPSSCKYDAFKVAENGVVPPASEPTVTKDAAGAYDRTFTWGITKDVDKTTIDIAPGGTATFNYTVDVTHDAGTDSNIAVTGTIDVENPNFDASLNTVPVDLTSVTDQLSDGTVCTVDTSGGLTLTGFDNFYPYSCTLNSLPQGQLDNTVTATWDDQVLTNGTVLSAGSAPFTFSGIAFTQTAIDDSVSVTDTLGGTLGTVTSSDPSPTEFTYSHDFTGDPAGTCTSHDNTATFTAGSGATNSDSKTVNVCVGADLTVSKTATPAFTRTYNWSIQKKVDKTVVKQVGGSATFNYSVTASETGFVDSGWSVGGVITVSNPNNWEAITATITDAIDNGGVCTVTNGVDVSIPAGGSVMRNYTCTYAAAPDPTNGTNTATATWDATAAFTTDSSATGTAGANFSTPSATVHKTITVTDTYAGTLGQLTATDSTPFTTHTYMYSRTIAIPTNGCLSYTNTATIVETGQTDSKTVKVCGPLKTGALTIGFWQNKNGQGIITGQAKTGVCASGTWLRQFAPFQDLSSTATCAGVATYVYNVIKAANCSTGGTCNAMLKAQMLATALDVYFSDPALGGNKIGAPGPIGGVAIDLTMICAMIDGSGGSASCGGSFENVSAAFGGATSLTVLQMLTFAASKSNVGGSVWYAQVKATQVLAKDAFDAINNGVAFGP